MFRRRARRREGATEEGVGPPNAAGNDASATAGDEARADPKAGVERERMVRDQLERRGIRDARVLAAMGSIPRELFIDQRLRGEAYADEALPIDDHQTISQPWIVARMTELLALRPGDRVLELGTGSGYQAAILAAIGAKVISIERHAGLAERARERLARLGLGDRVEIRAGDGSLGLAEAAPFDAVIVTAAAPRIPTELLDQLVDGGRLVIPVGSRSEQLLTLVVRQGNDWRQTTHGYCVFVPLIGDGGFPD